MAIRYSVTSDRFHGPSGRFVSRARGLRSGTARAQYQRSRLAGEAGRAALQGITGLAGSALGFLAPAAVPPSPVRRPPPPTDFGPEGFVTFPIFVPVSEEDIDFSTDVQFFDLLDMDMDTDESDTYKEEAA